MKEIACIIRGGLLEIQGGGGGEGVQGNATHSVSLNAYFFFLILDYNLFNTVNISKVQTKNSNLNMLHVVKLL